MGLWEAPAQLPASANHHCTWQTVQTQRRRLPSHGQRPVTAPAAPPTVPPCRSEAPLAQPEGTAQKQHRLLVACSLAGRVCGKATLRVRDARQAEAHRHTAVILLPQDRHMDTRGSSAAPGSCAGAAPAGAPRHAAGGPAGSGCSVTEAAQQKKGSCASTAGTLPRHDGLQSPLWVSEGRGTAPRHTLTLKNPEPAVRGHHVGCSPPTPPAASAGVGAAAKGDQVGLLQ